MMDPFENNLFDLPDYAHTEDEAFPPLPPPLNPGAEDEAVHLINGVEDSNGNRDSSPAEDTPLTVRKVMRRCMPKLDAQRLVSERGLPALRHMFDEIKFRGKGHEAEDLKVLIRHMEHWAHRLFPKLQFDDFVDRLEMLGNKKEVQTCLNRIRLDVPIIHEDFIADQGVPNGLDEVSEELELFSESMPQDPPSLLLPGSFLSEEKQQRIERNRQLALQRRQAKIQSSGTQAQAGDMVSVSFTAAPPINDDSSIETQDPDDLADDLNPHHPTMDTEASPGPSTAVMENSPVSSSGPSTAASMDQNEQLEKAKEN